MPDVRLISSLIAGALLFGGEAAAADRPSLCDTAMTTAELNLCSERNWQDADAELNAVFAKVVAAIRKTEQDKPYDAESWEKALRASQRTWVAFRDADCKGLLPMSWTGGTGTTSAVLACMTDKTKMRTEELAGVIQSE